MGKNVVLVICAHSDDEAAGMGGTILKYIAEGKTIVKVIFSYGESSHPHIQEKVTTKRRIKETHFISTELGIKKVIFLGLIDTKLKSEIEEKKIDKKLKKIIERYKPKQIFFPSSTDIHIDHRAVNALTVKVVDEIGYKGDLLAFEVWNIGKENAPYVYVDISDYFQQKVEMMKKFESQKLYMYPLLIPVYIKAKLYGIRSNCRHAERFYKIR